MHSEFDQEKKRAVNVATRSLERDLERLKADHATEIEEINEKNKFEVSENKKKQWVSIKKLVTVLKEHFTFSVSIVRLRRFTGVVGTLPTVP